MPTVTGHGGHGLGRQNYIPCAKEETRHDICTHNADGGHRGRCRGLRRSTGQEPRAWRAHATAARIHRRRGLVLASGAEDWVPAKVNTALAEGDEIYVADGGNAGAQLGTRAFVRAGSNTQIGLEGLDAGSMQFEVTGGHAAFDVARLPRGRRSKSIRRGRRSRSERPGYYRVDVDDQRTSFGARRGGIARVVAAESGDEIEIRGDQGWSGRQPSGLRHPADRGAGRLGSMELRGARRDTVRRRVARRTCRRTSRA